MSNSQSVSKQEHKMKPSFNVNSPYEDPTWYGAEDVSSLITLIEITDVQRPAINDQDQKVILDLLCG